MGEFLAGLVVVWAIAQWLVGLGMLALWIYRR